MPEKKLETLISKEQLQKRIQELGELITQDYRGKDLTLLIILKGGFLFGADLCRAINLPAYIEFLGVSSYEDEEESTGVVQITQDLKYSIEGRDVLIVEDIVDTGRTMAYLLANLKTRKPRSIHACSLLNKESKRCVDGLELAYTGFEIDDHFVIGYGLDDKGLDRNLPYIGYYPS
ncbi:MAG: hypoxanthine phosphoribosyltransferase [Candidatus Magasanikbacteria bacterium]|nr:hypoxanthine phosphoribosyltransferase [Candidatus Magasanikbacteria bacterium]|tara:strand:- start:97 stop:624 length:528 start_codon:yes stop_codon:yes gene_type:complete